MTYSNCLLKGKTQLENDHGDWEAKVRETKKVVSYISRAPQPKSPYLHVQPAMTLKILVHTLYSTVHNVSYLAGINSCDKPSQSISNDHTFVNTYSRIVSLSCYSQVTYNSCILSKHFPLGVQPFFRYSVQRIFLL